MQTITRQQAEEIFKAIKGSAFVGITTRTTPKLKGGKSNPQQGRIRKHSESSVFCGEAPKYKDMLEKKAADMFHGVNVDLTKAEINVTPMQVGKLWNGQGEHVEGAIVRHKTKGTKYVRVYFPKNARPKTRYTLDGEPIDKDDIEGLRKSRATEKTVEVNGEAVTVEIVPRVYKLESVIAFRHMNETYEVVADAEGGEISERDQGRDQERGQDATQDA